MTEKEPENLPLGDLEPDDDIDEDNTKLDEEIEPEPTSSILFRYREMVKPLNERLKDLERRQDEIEKGIPSEEEYKELAAIKSEIERTILEKQKLEEEDSKKEIGENIKLRKK